LSTSDEPFARWAQQQGNPSRRQLRQATAEAQVLLGVFFAKPSPDPDQPDRPRTPPPGRMLCAQQLLRTSATNIAYSQASCCGHRRALCMQQRKGSRFRHHAKNGRGHGEPLTSLIRGLRRPGQAAATPDRKVSDREAGACQAARRRSASLQGPGKPPQLLLALISMAPGRGALPPQIQQIPPGAASSG